MSTTSTTALGLALPREYGYVVTVTAATFFLGLWHGFRVSMARRPAGIAYPRAHADTTDLSSARTPEQKHAMHLFNCAQRAHGNFLENHPSVVMAMLISGVEWPVVTAGLGLVWMVGRVVYQIGYTSPTAENGKGRLPGYVLGAIPQLALYGMAAWTGVGMVR